MDTPGYKILGLGERSTALYIEHLKALHAEKVTNNRPCQIHIVPTDFNTINQLLPHPSQQLDDIVQSYLLPADASDDVPILIPNITLHETVDRLKIDQNISHPVQLSIKKILELGADKVVLLGSLYTMESAYIRSLYATHGIDVLLPNKEDRHSIDEVRKQFYNYEESQELIKGYHGILGKYADDYPVVIACTELSINLPLNRSNLIDMVQLQVEDYFRKVN